MKITHVRSSTRVVNLETGDGITHKSINLAKRAMRKLSQHHTGRKGKSTRKRPKAA